jgi:hypothetical protein
LRRANRTVSLLVALTVATSCTHLEVDDCPTGAVLGQDVSRIRSSHWRMRIGDPAVAAARFAPWALMSALAYANAETCASGQGLDHRERAPLERLLRESVSGAPWERVPELAMDGGCEDDLGFFYEVWKRRTPDGLDVAIVFRGTTSGTDDWLYGNLWWFTRFVFKDDQYTRARLLARRVLNHEWTQALPADSRVRFFAAGHSLGGGLAQHVLYAFPKQIKQALVFDPTAVTAFAALPEQDQLAGCSCDKELGSEARMLRVYESYEVLSDLRIFHKTFFPPHRHIQEVRFAFSNDPNVVSQHSMSMLATHLQELAKTRSEGADLSRWYANPVAECTARFEESQSRSCDLTSGGSAPTCPQ